MQVAVVSTRLLAARARMSVRHAASSGAAGVHVLDIDGSYLPTGDEHVVSPADAGLLPDALHRLAARLEPAQLVRATLPALVRHVRARSDAPVAALSAGVVLLGPLPDAAGPGHSFFARMGSAPALDGRRPDARDLADDGPLSPHLVVLRDLDDNDSALWTSAAELADPVGARWPGSLAAVSAHTVVREAAALLSAWNLEPEHVVGTRVGTGRGQDRELTLDGRAVLALDLTGLDPEQPWLLDPGRAGDPRGRLSDHPELALLVRQFGEELAADRRAVEDAPATGGWDTTRTSLGTPVDAPLRSLYESPQPGSPDPFDPRAREELLAWLTDPSPTGGPGRYLLAVRQTRADLAAAFPHVPGRDEDGYLAWAVQHAAAEGYSADLVEESARRAPDVPSEDPALSHGVNVVGFLRGELGIGESARLVVGALEAAGVAHTELPVETHLSSRQRPLGSGARHQLHEPYFDTSILCVNADLTATVVDALPRALGRTRRIGMWYWEVEDFPASQHEGLRHVDEVWVATDFIRQAVLPHASVPVWTLTPPLPQRSTAPPAASRADLGLPDRPLFLFAFDYLSTAERKNPLGLIEAFTQAFGAHDGPVLVLKSINAALRPAEAERVRLRAASAPHVLLIEEYLGTAERDALMSTCDCYVSLHRSEGLGLTMAEAMAWGKPVIATGYSGNLQFMTERNSFLVDWSPTQIPAGAEPYPAGSTWADPDLSHAARLMRNVLENPGDAAARGAQAAEDIAAQHSPAAAGARFAARLAAIPAENPSHWASVGGNLVRTTARRLGISRG